MSHRAGRLGLVVVFVLSAGVGGACGGGSSGLHDAGPRDAAVVDAGPRPDAACPGATFISGELVDFDSSAAAFAGVPGATITPLAGGAAITTPPNGRFELCAAGTPPLRFEVDAPGDRLDGVAYIDPRVPTSRTPTFRSFTAARAASFYQEHGLVFDPAKAHVLVFVAGDRSDIALDRPHAPALGGNDDDGVVAWSAEPLGRYVLFPNVDASTATAVLTGDLAGPHTIPIAAGTVTWVSVAWFYL